MGTGEWPKPCEEGIKGTLDPPRLSGGAPRRLRADPKPEWFPDSRHEGILLSMNQPRGFRPLGWADPVTRGGETVAELVDGHGSKLLELPK